jgi:glycosyltransferase involved in cell wall biosynthesis
LAPSQTNSDRVLTREHHLLDLVDSVYFLLFPGWESELRGNRWHFAVRWAVRKPVVLVIPTLTRGPARIEPEPRIPNCRILRIQMVDEQPVQIVKDTQVQVGQVLEDMDRHHFGRPLLWCYNWKLAGPYGRLPAVARLLHATEAHFDMPRLGPMLPRLRAAVAISDLTVAVSAGVAAGLRKRIEEVEIVTVSNGCDYRRYSEGKPDAALAATRQTYSRIATYAGNINGRLDFDLLRRLVTDHQDTLFALYGPVSSLSEADAVTWKELLNRPNVMAPGPVDPDRLPDLYAASDVGIIPYRQDPLLVDNGLPLKALEMSATGLPTVSSLMKPLLGMAAGMVVTSSADEFVAAFARVSRANLPAADLAELNRVSSANDYDNKFEQILEALDQHVTEPRATTRVDRLIDVLGPEWLAAEVRMSRWVAMPLTVRIVGWVVDVLARFIPAPLKRRLGSNRLREVARELRGD